MAYINGSELRIFPASNRSAGNQSNNNWLTEFNLSSIVNQLIAGTDIQGFVVTEGDPIEDVNKDTLKDGGKILKAGVQADNPIKTTSSIEFNIAGYYFQVSQIQYIIDAAENLSNSLATYLNFTKSTSDSITMYSATAKFWRDGVYNILLGSDSRTNGKDDTNPDSIPSGVEVKSIPLDLFYKKGSTYYIPASSRINFSGIQTFKHKDTRTQFTVKGAQITNYIIDDGEI